MARKTGYTLLAPRAALLLLLCALIAPSLPAQGPAGTPRSEGTIKAAVGIRPTLFEQQLSVIAARKASWLAKAAEATPTLTRKTLKPVARVKAEKDARSFQGWKIVGDGQPESACNKPLLPGDSFILDFGEHFTGYLTFSLRCFDIPVDAPVRLSFVFGEVPAEIGESFDTYSGTLTRSWLQDEVFNFDDVPQTVTLPRRYAFRYVKISVVSASKHGKFGFSDIHAEAVTSADESKLLPFTPLTAEDKALDDASRRTLRDCMQTVFEDGPKRDRRLWLGDLRLQALANYVTYRNYDLVKRSLYILAGTATENGLVGTCSFERPEPVRGGNSILDYTALFAPTVLEYLEASGDRATAEDLWPLVLKQLDFTLEPVNEEGLFVSPKKWWLFIDWQPKLTNDNKQASEHAIVLLGLRATLKLAEKLGKADEVAFIGKIIPEMEAAARKHLWDEAQGMFVSGAKRELVWASQAWMVLAGVASPEQAKRAMSGVMKSPDAVKPVTPYMHHYVVEALLAAGLRDEASGLLQSYWGGMIRKGADTFWEVYLPEDDFASPYGGYLMNSYCHAWSCTPTYLLRRFQMSNKQTN
jgi:alpha-L-rhamnosidase